MRCTAREGDDVPFFRGRWCRRAGLAAVAQDVDQLPRAKQEFRSTRPAERGMGLCKGFVNQQATRGHSGLQGRKQGAPQVVGDDDGVELPPRQWPGIGLQVGEDGGGQRGQRREQGGVAVDRGELVARVAQPMHVAAMAARDVEHLGAGRQKRRPAHHPVGGQSDGV
jgi:hypothetical protein